MKTLNKLVKVGAVSPRIRLCDVAYNVNECITEAKRANELGARVLVFPELTFSGVTCFDLYLHSVLVNRIEKGVADFIEATKDLDMISFVGAPVMVDSACYNSVVAIYRGEILGIAPKAYVSPEQSRYFDVPTGEVLDVTYAGRDTVLDPDTVITAPFDEDLKIGVTYGEGANLVVNLMASEATLDSEKLRIRTVRAMSGAEGKAYIYANAGVGESTTDAVYSAHNVIADRGQIVAEAKPFASDTLAVGDIRVAEPTPSGEYNAEIQAILASTEIPAIPPMDPFLSSDKDERTEQCLAALEIQSQGLAARIQRSYSKTMVIGVSGGLDSTLALLVCARAADILGMDRNSIIGVTMPCFGTTKRTKSNAEKLCEALGTTLRVVDIKASVTQHLKDIGHDGETPDVTYENAQARERTQVIMDIANMSGGLVVGTGDLSELALGWATYNGDHMSMYAVNGSVTKTMVRRIVEVYSERDRKNGGACADILDDILATPVSPELLPPKDGEIAQCTESLVGPYELHDYFIYYTLRHGLSPREIYGLAKRSFEGVYDNQTILGWLRVFVRRFFNQQFKRSCLPDGPKVGPVSVSPRCDLRMPSDASAAVWQSELDEIEKEEK